MNLNVLDFPDDNLQPHWVDANHPGPEFEIDVSFRIYAKDADVAKRVVDEFLKKIPLGMQISSPRKL